MPHIILEYPQSLLDNESVIRALKVIHQSIADSGLFKANQIKTHAYPFQSFTNGGGSELYLHIQARIKSGRDAENKKRFADVILSGLRPLTIPASVITVEVIDMDRDSYGKYAP